MMMVGFMMIAIVLGRKYVEGIEVGCISLNKENWKIWLVVLVLRK